jgi:hypothetical protein
MIDVLRLKGHAVVAAFEIERTTSIHSGLLRMADLVAVQPNLNIARCAPSLRGWEGMLAISSSVSWRISESCITEEP